MRLKTQLQVAALEGDVFEARVGVIGDLDGATAEHDEDVEQEEQRADVEVHVEHTTDAVAEPRHGPLGSAKWTSVAAPRPFAHARRAEDVAAQVGATRAQAGPKPHRLVTNWTFFYGGHLH